VKIDRGFYGMTENADDTSIVSIINFPRPGTAAQGGGRGVETEQQGRCSSCCAADQVQGYLFSPPLPVERIEALLKSL